MFKTILIAFLLSFQVIANDKIKVPNLTRPIEDLTNTLSSEDKKVLEDRLYSLKDRNIIQMAVLIVPTLEGNSIEEYSIAVVDEWKLGQKKVDNGLLLLLAIKERKIRVEVGRGLQGDLTDIKAKRIIQAIKPFVKIGDFSNGIRTSIDEVEQIFVKKEIGENVFETSKKEVNPEYSAEKEKEIKKVFKIVVIIFLVFLVFMFLLAILAVIFGKGGGGSSSSGSSGSSSGGFFDGGSSSGGSSYDGGGGGFDGGGASDGFD